MSQVLIIGSANTEMTIVLEEAIAEDKKLEFKEMKEGVGGSAVNWSSWLVSAGKMPIVFCPIGDVGDGANRIRNAFHNIGITPNATLPNQLPEEPAPPENARHSFVLVTSQSRTVLSSSDSPQRWLTGLAKGIQAALTMTDAETGKKKNDFKVAMIGNIPTDPASSIANTTAIIKQLRGVVPGIFIYANFGSQLKGKSTDFLNDTSKWTEWKDVLQEIDCFQFDLCEAKTFVKNLEGKQPEDELSLEDLLHQCINRKWNAIVTLGQGGAVSVFAKDKGDKGPKNVFFTWPRPPKPLTDPTGAGDAFGAGFVESVVALFVHGPVPLSDQMLKESLNSAGYFGSRACQKLGGSGACPKDDEKDEFQSIIRNLNMPGACDYQDSTQLKNLEDASCILHALDRTC